MEQIRKFTFDVGWVIASSIVTLFLGFLLRPVLARWLGAADLGLLLPFKELYWDCFMACER